VKRPESKELDILFASVEELRQAETALKELKKKIAKNAHGLSDISDTKTRISAGVYSYWYAPEVNAKDIAFGVTGQLQPYTLLKLAGPISVGIPCDRCNKDLPIRSRAQMKSTMDKVRGGYAWAEGYRVVCLPCEEAIHEERFREYELERAKQRVREYELKGMPYRQYLATADWQETRCTYLANYVHWTHALECETCNADASLGVYHKTPDGIGKSYDLVLLCITCRDALVVAGKLAGEPSELNLVPKTVARQVLQAHRDRIGQFDDSPHEGAITNG